MASAPTENRDLVCLGPAKRGRPERYTDELAHEICERIAAGETLAAICEDEHMPARRTVTGWLMRDHEGFVARYAHARELQAIHEDEECKAIADNAYEDYYIEYTDKGPVIRVDGNSVARAKLRIETRRWRAERLNRRVYGQSVKHEHTVNPQAEAGADALPPGIGFLAGFLGENNSEKEG